MAKLRLSLLVLIAAGLVCGCMSNRGSGLLTNDANPAAYHFQMGLSFLGERNYTNALIELTEAVQLDPDNPEVLYNLGLAYLGKRRPDLSVKQFQRAIELKPNYSSARNDLGVAFIELKRWDQAIEQFRIVKDDIFYANTENAAINLGLAYLGKGDFSKAMDELAIVASSNPSNPIAKVAMGRVLFAMGKTEQALAEFQRALRLYKEYGAAHFYLGMAQLKLNRQEEARQAFKETIRILPDSELARQAAGYLELMK